MYEVHEKVGYILHKSSGVHKVSAWILYDTFGFTDHFPKSPKMVLEINQNYVSPTSD